MRRLVIFPTFIFLGSLACVMPGMTPPTPIPTFDQNLISTMVIQTAEAFGAFQPTPTPASLTVTVMLVIGEAVAMTPMGSESPQIAPTAVFMQMTFSKDCPVMNLVREAQMVDLINAERAKAGLRALGTPGPFSGKTSRRDIPIPNGP